MGRSVYKFGSFRLSRSLLNFKIFAKYIIPLIGIIFLASFYPLTKRSTTSTKFIDKEEYLNAERPLEAVAALGQITPIGETRFLAAPLLTGGGIIPDIDMKKLESIGVGKLFGPGTPVEETINYIKKLNFITITVFIIFI